MTVSALLTYASPDETPASYIYHCNVPWRKCNTAAFHIASRQLWMEENVNTSSRSVKQNRAADQLFGNSKDSSSADKKRHIAYKRYKINVFIPNWQSLTGKISLI